MARFLNTDSILTEFKKLTNTAKKELILITPYIDIMNEVLQTFSLLEKRGVEVLLICREGVLSQEEPETCNNHDAGIFSFVAYILYQRGAIPIHKE